MLSSVEHEKSFITSGPGSVFCCRHLSDIRSRSSTTSNAVSHSNKISHSAHAVTPLASLYEPNVTKYRIQSPGPLGRCSNGLGHKTNMTATSRFSHL